MNTHGLFWKFFTSVLFSTTQRLTFYLVIGAFYIFTASPAPELFIVFMDFGVLTDLLLLSSSVFMWRSNNIEKLLHHDLSTEALILSGLKDFKNLEEISPSL